ncbi:MAG: MarR family transcriptional regulator [Pseudomonadota bacterium]
MSTGKTRVKQQAPKSLEKFLSYRLHLINKITDRRSSNDYMERFGLPVGEARCLAAIGNFEPLSINDLAGKANLDKGQASRAAQALVTRGFVSKESSTSDGRGVVITLTKVGRPVWTSVMQLIEERNRDIFGCLTASERAALGNMLDRLAVHARGSLSHPDLSQD